MDSAARGVSTPDELRRGDRAPRAGTASGLEEDAGMSTLEDILDQLYFTATDERDKGDSFERLMLQLFKTDRAWSERFADVWTWTDWPERDGRRDNGIDLVATDRQTGEAVAIQCKFFDPGLTLYKQHIDSFLSEWSTP